MPMPMPAAARKILKNREADAEADAGWYKKIYTDAGSNIFDSDSEMLIPTKMPSASHPCGEWEHGSKMNENSDLF